MQQMVQTIQAIARHEMARASHAQLGVVSSVFGHAAEPDYACTVTLRESGIVLPRAPIATGLIGSVGLPVEGDLVVVLFMDGDLHAPVIVGRLYSEKVDPPKHGPGEVVIAVPGHVGSEDEQIVVKAETPEGGGRTLSITLAGQTEVKVTLDDEKIVLAAGEAKLTLSQSGASDGLAEIAVGQAKVSVAQGGDVAVETTGKLSLKATEIEIAGDASVKITGAAVELN